MYDPQLGRWHVQDKFSEKYYSLSPYNYVANNPMIFNDPTGDTINYTFESVQAMFAFVGMLAKFSEEKLNGQFSFSLSNSGDGSFTLGMNATKGGGNLSKLDDGGKAFHTVMNSMINGNTVLEQTIAFNRRDVDVIDSKQNIMDVRDMAAYDKPGGGPTSLSLFTHETVEQYNKSALGLGPGEPNWDQKMYYLYRSPLKSKRPEIDFGHNKALEWEQKVCGYRRDGEKFHYNNGRVTTFKTFKNPITGRLTIEKIVLK